MCKQEEQIVGLSTTTTTAKENALKCFATNKNTHRYIEWKRDRKKGRRESCETGDHFHALFLVRRKSSSSFIKSPFPVFSYPETLSVKKFECYHSLRLEEVRGRRENI